MVRWIFVGVLSFLFYHLFKCHRRWLIDRFVDITVNRWGCRWCTQAVTVTQLSQSSNGLTFQRNIKCQFTRSKLQCFVDVGTGLLALRRILTSKADLNHACFKAQRQPFSYDTVICLCRWAITDRMLLRCFPLKLSWISSVPQRLWEK